MLLRDAAARARVARRMREAEAQEPPHQGPQDQHHDGPDATDLTPDDEDAPTDGADVEVLGQPPGAAPVGTASAGATQL